MSTEKTMKAAVPALILLGLVILLYGLAMLAGGAYLIALGGSWFFAPAGLALASAGWLIVRRSPLGAALYLAMFAVTVAWSLWEAGLTFWPLFSRLFAMAVLALLLLLLMPAFHRGGDAFRRRPAQLWP